MPAAVHIAALNVSFFNTPVLRDIHVDFPAGAVTVLAGRSGSGKTTLLRAVNRLNEELPGHACTGRVLVDIGNGPQDIYAASAMPPTELRLKAGMLFQTPNLFPMSVYKNMALPLTLTAGCPKSELAETIDAALEAVGLLRELHGKMDMPAERLSGGQQQRLCLARVLALQPAILLLDEPTAFLDVHAVREVEELLLGLAGRYTIIMVSHSPDQAVRMGGEIVVCRDGRITQRLRPGENPTDALEAV